MLRTHNCGELTQKDIGKCVSLCGWVHTVRDHGGVIFIDLRDKHGFTQVVFNPQMDKAIYELSGQLKSEFFLLIKGDVMARPPGTENKKIVTGFIEINASSLEVLNTSPTPPFEISDDVQVNDELRYKYRFLDIRRPKVMKNIQLRCDVFKIIRDYMAEQGFLDVETPILTKSTPEGARDYLVPSRLCAGKFYALPQSPQLFKQLLMMAGLEKYYQIAKCFRDEDLRADRQPEFTQLDIEMSFIDQEDLFVLIENLIARIFKQLKGIDIKLPLPRLAYNEAIAKYGSDKPDTRFGLEFIDLTKELIGSGFDAFQKAIDAGAIIIAMKVPNACAFSRSKIDELIVIATNEGAKGLAYFKFALGKLDSPIVKFFNDKAKESILAKIMPQEGDLILMIADVADIAYKALSKLRLALGGQLNLIDKNKFNFLWVVDFPLFKYNKDERRWESEHHPFTSPNKDDIGLISQGRLKDVRSSSYDIVVNGNEIGSGSIRIHRSDVQQLIFDTIGITREQARLRFGFLIDALSFGAPPHGGVALGLDRFITLLSGEDSIREVIAFPKTQKGICLLTDAPSEVDEQQLKELNISLRKKEAIK